MNTLIILAHPSQDGLSRKISETYKLEKIKKWNNVEILDLYREWSQEYLYFEDRAKIWPMPKTIEIQSKIKNSDEMVFIFPLWRWGMPAIMKNFIDCNFSSWFAYKYTSKWPIGLLKDKKATLIITCDAPWIFFKIFPISIKYFFKFIIFGFCGIKLNHFELIDKVRTKRKNWSIEKVLEKITKLASN